MKLKYGFALLLCLILALCLISCGNNGNEGDVTSSSKEPSESSTTNGQDSDGGNSTTPSQDSDENNSSASSNEDVSKPNEDDNTHTVTFITHSDSVIAPVSVKHNTQIPVQAKPEKAGYTFDGWYLGDEKWSFISHIVTIDLTLEAKWIPNENTLSFDGNGATSGAMAGVTLKTDEKATLSPNAFLKTGYTFAGWSTTKGGEVEYTDGKEYTMGTNSAYTLFAVWQANENSLIFDANGGIGAMQMTIATDSSANLLQNIFTKTGYTFIGWSTTADGEVEYTDGAEYIMGTEPAYTLYAVWQVNINGVIFDANGGKGAMEVLEMETGATATLLLNTHIRAGYTFIGWSTSADGKVEYTNGAEYTMGTESRYTLYAVWQANNNSLVFDANGGNGTMENMTIATDSTANLTANTLTKPGYAFMGWSTTKDGEVEYTDGQSYKMGTNSSYTLYAVWEANENTLVFDANGGSGTMENMTISTDSTANLNANAFTKTGYTFMGWSTTKDGQVEYTDGKEYKMGANASYTLYAIWKIDVYTITYEKNGGTGELAETFTVNDLPLKLNDLNNRENHLFNYWYNESDFSGEPVFEITELGNVTLYAEYVECTDGLVLAESNGAYTVIDYTGTASEVVIPQSYKGKKIESIGYGIFRDCIDITKITLPFVGSTLNGTSITHFGYIFGAPTYYHNGNYVPSSLKKVIITGGNSIGEEAFSGCTSLTNVTIGDSVISIGKRAFYNCTNLTSITIPDSITSIGEQAFSDCKNLTSITIPDSVTSIGEQAFYNCKSLTSITLPDSVTSIGEQAFFGCTSLTSITIPDSVTNIGERAFNRCTSLTSITIPDSVTSIDEYAFSSCSSLVSVNYLGTIGQWCNINFIGFNANPLCNKADFYLNGELMTELIIPKGVTKIGSFAFEGCTSLTSITIPDSVTSISGYAFYGYNSLVSVNYLGTIAQWCTISFGNSDANPLCNGADFYLNGELLTELVIPEGVTSINDYAFYYCSSLASVEIPTSVTSIGSSAFSRCSSLKSVTYKGTIAQWCNISFDSISSNPLYNGASLFLNGELLTELVIPDSVTSIGYAFSGCTSLTSVEIPNSVTSIADNAFYNCTSLTSVVIPHSVASIGSYAFYGCSSLTINCEVESALYTWDNDWNPSKCPVVWSYNHTYTTEVILEPTHLATGQIKYTCQDCGVSYIDQIEKSPVHSYVDGICPCGAVKLASLVSIETNEGNARKDMLQNLVDGSIESGGIYGDTTSWCGNVGDYLLLTFEKETEIKEMAMYLCGNWTWADVEFIDGNGNVIHTVTGESYDNRTVAYINATGPEGVRTVIFQSGDTDANENPLETLTVKQVKITVASLKWQRPSTYLITEIEFTAVPPTSTEVTQ